MFTIGLPGVFSLTRWCWQIQPEFHLLRPTQDTARNPAASFTGLSPSLAGLPRPFKSLIGHLLQSYYPTLAVTNMVWAAPRSLATTCGITVVFSSCRYLDVSVPCVCLPPINQGNNASSMHWVVPFGYPRIKSYVPIPVAFRSLSRPSSPLGAKASPIRPYLLPRMRSCLMCSRFSSYNMSMYVAAPPQSGRRALAPA